jgi:hypothetical protein
MGIAGPVASQRAGSHWIARAMAGVPRESMAAGGRRGGDTVNRCRAASVHRAPDFLSWDPRFSLRAASAARISPQIRGESVCPQGVMGWLV